MNGMSASDGDFEAEANAMRDLMRMRMYVGRACIDGERAVENSFAPE